MIVSGARTKVMIVSDDPAGGHRATARAVNEALHQMADVDSVVCEFQEMGSKPRQIYREQQFNFMFKTAKPLTRFIFRQSMQPGELLRWFWRTISWANHWTLLRAQAMVKKEDPDILLSVHMATNALSRIWQKHHALNAPTHCVVTDYVAFGVWPSENIRRYYVASEAVKKDMESFGVASERLMVTGIPVSPQIVAPDARPQREVKLALGLQPDRPMILVMGGSKGDQQYLPILQELERLGSKAQVVALCGRNPTRRQEVEAFAHRLSFPVYAKPFVEMRDYYHAADVVITKPGGLTTSEVMAKGKAMVLVSPYPGMEEEQVRRLTAAGVALYGDSAEGAAEQAVRLVVHPALREELSSAARAFVKPDAAMVIARDLVASRRTDRSCLPQNTPE